MSVTLLARPRSLADLSMEQLRLVGAVRLWPLAAKMRCCPLKAIAGRLGNLRAAAHLQLMIEEMGAAWPDPFCVAPPGSPAMTHDEATLAEMIEYAACGDRPAFDRLLADLLPAYERERLFLSASLLGPMLGA